MNFDICCWSPTFQLQEDNNTKMFQVLTCFRMKTDDGVEHALILLRGKICSKYSICHKREDLKKITEVTSAVYVIPVLFFFRADKITSGGFSVDKSSRVS